MKVLSGPSSTMFGTSLARFMDCSLVDREITRFPDGELYVRIMEDVTDEFVVLVQTTYPDEHIVELFVLQDALREAGVSKLATVVPYFGYSRQDKLFRAGEAVTARAMARHIQLESDHLIFVDLHSPRIREWCDVNALEVHASQDIANHLVENGVEIDFVLSPDKGAIDRASRVAEALGVPFDHLEKKRLDGENVIMTAKSLDVTGRDVLIVDDIIATGGTIIKAAEQLRRNGAGKIHAACTHGLYTGGSIPRLREALDGLYSSDTIESGTSVFSAARPVAEALKTISRG